MAHARRRVLDGLLAEERREEDTPKFNLDDGDEGYRRADKGNGESFWSTVAECDGVACCDKIQAHEAAEYPQFVAIRATPDRSFIPSRSQYITVLTLPNLLRLNSSPPISPRPHFQLLCPARLYADEFYSDYLAPHQIPRPHRHQSRVVLHLPRQHQSLKPAPCPLYSQDFPHPVHSTDLLTHVHVVQILALLAGISITTFATAVNLSTSASLSAQILFGVSIVATFLATVSSTFAVSVPYLESRQLHCGSKDQLRTSQALSVAAAVILGLVTAVSMAVAKLLS